MNPNVGKHLAKSSSDRFGNPIIVIHPIVYGDVEMSSELTIAHECAHHIKGHVFMDPRRLTPSQIYGFERDADCWAARQLKRAGRTHELKRGILLMRRNGTADEKRVSYFISCARIMVRG